MNIEVAVSLNHEENVSSPAASLPNVEDFIPSESFYGIGLCVSQGLLTEFDGAWVRMQGKDYENTLRTMLTAELTDAEYEHQWARINDLHEDTRRRLGLRLTRSARRANSPDVQIDAEFFRKAQLDGSTPADILLGLLIQHHPYNVALNKVIDHTRSRLSRHGGVSPALDTRPARDMIVRTLLSEDAAYFPESGGVVISLHDMHSKSRKAIDPRHSWRTAIIAAAVTMASTAKPEDTAFLSRTLARSLLSSPESCPAIYEIEQSLMNSMGAAIAMDHRGFPAIKLSNKVYRTLQRQYLGKFWLRW